MFLFFLVEEVTTTTKAATTKSTPAPKIKGCPIKMIPNEERLKQRNLIIQKIECIKKNNIESGQCFPKESLVKYKCKDGYKFENNKSKYSLAIFEHNLNNFLKKFSY